VDWYGFIQEMKTSHSRPARLRSVRRILSLLILVLCACPLHAQEQFSRYDQAELDILKGSLNFDSWPGKRLPLIPGYAFEAKNHRTLAGFSLVTDWLYLGADNTVERRLTLVRGKTQFLVSVLVAQTSSSQAHERLASRFFARQRQWSAPPGVRGKTLGLRAGTLSFVQRAHAARKYRYSQIEFVRNNILITLHVGDANAADLESVAGAIDADLLQSATVAKLANSGQAPIITSLSSKAMTIKLGESTRIVASISNPLKGKLHQEFRKTSGTLNHNGGRIEFVGTSVGRVTVTLVVANEKLLLAKESILITVVAK